MEKREHFNEDPNLAGELTVAFDTASGRVRCIGSGFWSVRQATAFFADWTQIIRQIHRAGRPVSALVDMSESGVQSADVADIIASATSGLYQPGDAISMLVPTSLAKMQMRRVLAPEYHGFFISRHAAETWLQGRALSDQTTVAYA